MSEDKGKVRSYGCSLTYDIQGYKLVHKCAFNESDKRYYSNIIQEINNISQETLMKVVNRTVERARQCLTNNGGHLKDIAFHT